MKTLILISVLFFPLDIFGQLSDQVTQLSKGSDVVSIKIIDFDTNEPIIGAVVFSILSKDTLTTTDIEGNGSFRKGVSGNLEILYVGYDPLCFNLNSPDVDYIVARIKLNVDIGFKFYTYNVDSLFKAAKKDAEADLKLGIVRILDNGSLSKEQNTYAKNHSFVFYKMENKNEDYLLSYNEIVLDYLSTKFGTDIREELRAICWRNYYWRKN
jgi:hypothetical protein